MNEFIQNTDYEPLMTSYFGLLVLGSGGYRGKIFSGPKTAKFAMLGN